MIKLYAVIEKRIIGLGRIVHTASESYEDWTVQETNRGLYKNKEAAEVAAQNFKISYGKSSSHEEKEFVVQEIQIKD